MATIKKKIWPEYFEKISNGQKTYDFRLADFAIKTGDELILQEFDPKTKQFTGREITKKVGSIGKITGPEPYSQEDFDKYGCLIISLLD